VKDDNSSGDEILSNQPSDVPRRRVDRVVRVRAAKHALVPARSGKPELPGPCHSIFTARNYDLFVVSAVRSATARLLSVVETRPAKIIT